MNGPFYQLLLVLSGMHAVGVGVHLNAMRRGTHRTAHAYLALICLICFIFLLIQAQLFECTDLEQHSYWRRISNVVTLCLLVAYPRFIALCTGAERSVVPLLFAVPAFLLMIEDVTSVSGSWFGTITELHRVELPWHEVVVVPTSPTRLWRLITVACFVAMSLYALWRVLRSRRLVGAVTGTPLVISNLMLIVLVLQSMLVNLGLGRLPLAALVPPFLAAGGWWRIASLDRQRIASLRELFQHSVDGIVICSPDRARVLAANATAQRLFARVGADLDDAGLKLVLGEGGSDTRSERPSIGSGTMPALRTVYSRDLRAQGGGWVLIEIGLRNARLEGENRLLVTVRDLTDRRRLEREVVENERRLRLVIERSPIPILQASRAGRVLAVNPAYARSFGGVSQWLKPDAGWSDLLLDDPLRGAQLSPEWRLAIAGTPDGEGILPSLPAVIISSSAGPRQVDACGVIDRDRLFIFITDLTEILATQQAINRRRGFYQAIIATAADGIAVIDEYHASGSHSGELKRVAGVWNPSMEEITGISAGAAARLGVDPSGEVPFDALVRQLLALPEHEEVDIAVSRPDGSRRQCVVSTSMLPRTAGGRRILVVLRDVSAAMHAEAARRAAQAQAFHAQKLESIGILAGGIAHDFNNLLMSILGPSSLIAAALPETTSLKRQALDMERSARLAADLCQQLQTYAGQGSAALSVVDLRALTSDLGSVLEVTLPKRIVFASSCSGDVGTVVGDGGQLRQLAMNLLLNAADAIGEGGGRVSLRLACTRLDRLEPVIGGAIGPGDFVVLEVEDDGSGMDEATIAKIFEPFFTTKPRGRGLGLAAARGIVAGHGGGLQVLSTPGRGTTMRVLLPASSAAAAAVAAPAPAVPGSARGAVLVVDDEAEVLTTTTDLLRHLGYQVQPFQTGAAAVASLAAAPGPVVGALVDLTMPDCDGVEVIERLRRIVPGLPVVIASGHSDAEVRRRIGETVVAGVLQKPYDLAALAQALRAWEELGPPAAVRPAAEPR